MNACLFGMEAELAVSATRGELDLPVDAVAYGLAQVAQRTLVHLRDSGRRMFLSNGGLFYVDYGSHPEVATPECTNPTDAVSYELAGERIVSGLARAARDELRADAVHVYRSNLDYSGATWGCHESYLGRRPVLTYEDWLVPHLVSRIVYTGSGGLDPNSPGIRMSLSPRAAYIDRVVSAESTGSRGVFHTRDEPLCNGYSRIHVLAGDNACSQHATWLKIGTTALVAAMADAGASSVNWPRLVDPVGAMKGFALDIGHRTRVRQGRKRTLMTAVEIQRQIMARVVACSGGEQFPPWAAEVCEAWKVALDLVEAPQIQDGIAFDWPLKFDLFRREIAGRGFTEPMILVWSEVLERLVRQLPQGHDKTVPPDLARIDQLSGTGALTRSDLDEAARSLATQGLRWEGLDDFIALRRQLCSIDIRFGEIGAGIFDTLDRQGMILHHRVVDEARIRQAVTEAPRDTRAHLRGAWVKRLCHGDKDFQCNWEEIRGSDTALDLRDPFATEAEWKTSIDPMACRWRALECYLDGRYREAEALLTTALDAGFEPANIHCHLARLCLVTGRIDAAGAHAEQAWQARAGAAPYVLARTLWLQLAAAYLDSGDGFTPDGDSAVDAGLLIGKLKCLLQQRSAVIMEWTMQPVLDQLESRLADEQCALLGAFVKAMSDGRFDTLESLESWRSQDAIAV